MDATGDRPLKVALMLLGPAPERWLHAADAIATMIGGAGAGVGDRAGGGGVVLSVHAEAEALIGRRLPGAGLTVRPATTAVGADPGPFHAGPGAAACWTGGWLDVHGARDCDLWLIVGEETGLPVSAARPLALWLPDMADRLPGGAPAGPDWAAARQGAVMNRLGAARVLVHDAAVRLAAERHALVAPGRIVTVPFPQATSLPAGARPAPERTSPWIYWHVQPCAEETERRVVDILDLYYLRHFGQCGVVLGGPGGALAGLAPAEAAWRDGLRDRLSAHDWGGALCHRLPDAGPDTVQPWAARARALIVTSGRGTNHLVTDLARQHRRPLLVIGPETGPEAAAGQLKAAERGAPDPGLIPDPAPAAGRADGAAWIAALAGLHAATAGVAA
jgi:hypothetical protein